MRSSRLRTFALSVTLGLAAVLAAHAQGDDARNQRVIVTVVDKAGKPVAGLGPADFVVREDGAVREILRVEPAGEPMQLLMLVDTSDNMRLVLIDLRNALKTFSHAIWEKVPESEIGLMEFGERPNMLVDAARAPNLLDRAIDRLQERSGSGAYLLDAILNATNYLKKRKATRPVIAIFTRTSSSEFSTRQHTEIEDAVKSARATLWAVVLQESSRGRLSDEAQQREVVIGDVVTRSGGLRDILLDRGGMEARAQQLSGLLTSQYRLVYSRPDRLIPPTKLDVSVKRAGASALATHWTGQ